LDAGIEQFTNTVQVEDDGANGPDPTPENNVARDTDAVDMILSRVSGFVYVDLDNNGIMGPAERPIAGVAVRLVGTDARGNGVDRATTTGPAGQYVFEDVAPGLYDLLETQPALFRDGRDTPGFIEGDLRPLSNQASLQVLDDHFAQLGVGPGVEAQDFNFGELIATTSKRRYLGSRL
jgi:hypothetical protein